ncbi:hypothetical protein BJ170DRAFT_640210 [Xylariales sp. AK1849]|nr:hypothetical protein BJ170DRAFT_640210 [Xylariales sp. AK1849]
MTAADAFSKSDLDYETWAQRMVDEGKMYYPEKRSVEIGRSREKETVVVRHPGGGLSFRAEPRFTLTLENIICEGLGGNKADYDKGRQRFCQLNHDYASVLLMTSEYILQDFICEGDSDACDLLITAAFISGRMYYNGAIEDDCDTLFEAVHKQCNDLGGVAEIVIKDSQFQNDQVCGQPICTAKGVALKSGYFQALFFQHDSGFTCPANSAQQVCKVERF